MIVAVNVFAGDTEAEVGLVKERALAAGAAAAVPATAVPATHWATGSAGAVELAKAVVAVAEGPKPAFK